jgi:hypothetical protein
MELVRGRMVNWSDFGAAWAFVRRGSRQASIAAPLTTSVCVARQVWAGP